MTTRRFQSSSGAALRQLPKKGDHEGYAEFYRRYEGSVMAYMRRRVATSELAADLTMEVFAAGLLAIQRDVKPPDDAVSWLFGIAHHKLVDAYRTGRAEDRARHQLGLDPIALSDADLERIDRLTDEARVLEMLEQLPADQRDAVRARVIDDRSYEDIARELKSSSIAVRQRVSRGLKNLRSQMKEQP